MHEAFPFRHWSSRRGRIDGAVARSSVSRSSAGFLEVAVEGGRIPLPLALHWVSRISSVVGRKKRRRKQMERRKRVDDLQLASAYRVSKTSFV